MKKAISILLLGLFILGWIIDIIGVYMAFTGKL